MLEVATGSEKSQFFDQTFLNILIFKKSTMELNFQRKTLRSGGTVVSKNYFKVVINNGLYF